MGGVGRNESHIPIKMPAMRKTERDAYATQRKGRKQLIQKYQEHGGGICLMRRKWTDGKLRRDAKELLGAADADIRNQFGDREKIKGGKLT